MSETRVWRNSILPWLIFLVIYLPLRLAFGNIWRADKDAFGSLVGRTYIAKWLVSTGAITKTLILWPNMQTFPWIRNYLSSQLTMHPEFIVINESNPIVTLAGRAIQGVQNLATTNRVVRKLTPRMALEQTNDPQNDFVVLPDWLTLFSPAALDVCVQELKEVIPDLHKFISRPFVCFNFRDSTYDHNLDYAYSQSYRCVSFQTFSDTLNALRTLGIRVVRTGRSDIAIPSEYPFFYDYATHPNQNDMIDVALYARCQWVVEVGSSGANELAVQLRKPMLSIHMAPLTAPRSVPIWMCVPALLRDITTQDLVPLSDYFRLRLTDIEFQKDGLEVCDPDSTVVFGSVCEFEHLLRGTWRRSSQDEYLTNLSRRIIEEEFRAIGSPNSLERAKHFKISNSFLRKYSLILGEK